VTKTSSQKNLLEFPCRFPVKAMGRNRDDFASVVSAIVLRHAEIFPGDRVTTNASGEGNFLSVTVTIEAKSRSQLDRIYTELTICDQVLMAL
jgi:putative lipoic acid-binding regulatory protein